MDGPGKTEPPWMVDSLRDPNTGARCDLDRLRCRPKLERLRVEWQPVVYPRDTQRLTDAPWSRAQQPFLPNAAAAPHGGKTMGGLERTDQHGTRAPFGLAYEIYAPVNAVGPVDVGVTRRPKHDGVALGLAVVGVRRRVGVMVRLDLNYWAADSSEQKRGADQVGSDFVHASGKK
jgi:hypothetical protein